MSEREENLTKVSNNVINSRRDQQTNLKWNQKSLQAFGIWKPNAETLSVGIEEIKHSKPKQQQKNKTIWQTSLLSNQRRTDKSQWVKW